jgi:hypothetical protein
MAQSIGLNEWTTGTTEERNKLLAGDRMPSQELLNALNRCPGDVPNHSCVICEGHDRRS